MDIDFPLSNDIFLLDFSNNYKLYNLFSDVYKLWITKPVGYYFKCLSIVYQILYEMVLKNEKYSQKDKFIKIEKGIDYLKYNLYSHIDFYEPSKVCNISYTYFKKLFIEKYGVSPVKYVNNMRLERSKELLLINKYSVGEISEMCGFESSYYFSKKFKEKYHISPSEYKKSFDKRI